MGIVKTARLVYEYIRRDEEEKIEKKIQKHIQKSENTEEQKENNDKRD